MCTDREKKADKVASQEMTQKCMQQGSFSKLLRLNERSKISSRANRLLLREPHSCSAMCVSFSVYVEIS